MLNKIAEVKNVRGLMSMTEMLTQRPAGTPGIGLIWGATGYGKTTAAARMVVHSHAIFERADAVSTPRTLLAALCVHLSLTPARSADETLHLIAAHLKRVQRPVVIDEADYLLDKRGLIETIRDLHDRSTVAVILIGMANFLRQVKQLPQFSGRIAHWAEFAPADAEDARVLADTICEVRMEDDLLAALLEQTRGSMRGLTMGLMNVEEFGKRRKLSNVGLSDWGKKRFFINSIHEAE